MLCDPTAAYKSAYIWNTFFHLLKWNPCPFYTQAPNSKAFTEIFEIDISEQKNERGEKCLSLPIFPFQLPFNPFYSLLRGFFFVSFVVALMVRLAVNTAHSGALLHETMTYITY
jgi:hypothetical protein